METDKTILAPSNTGSDDGIYVLKNTFAEHGNEIEEIISKKPPFIVRWGTLFFLTLLLLIGLTTWFIQYPDIVIAKAKLTSINAPKEVKTRTAGKLVELFAKEKELIKQGDILGYLENTANYHGVIELSGNVNTLQSLMNTNDIQKLIPYLNSAYPDLGELQQPYQTFQQAFINFRNYISGGFYLSKKNMLSKDLKFMLKLHNNLLQQKYLNVQDLELSQKTFNANQSLNNDKVISDLDYRNETSKLINKKLTLPQISSAIINNESQQNEKQKEIMELDNTIAQQKSIFLQSLNTLKSQINEWKNKYLLIAPASGKIIFASFLQENQQLQNNQTVCFINPENTQYFAEVYIPQSNFGKIKPGQKVLLKLPAYPYPEFGAIAGKLDFISNIPTDSGYLAKVILPNGLQTNYKKQIQYHEGLSAQAEIITSDLKLSDRLLNQLRSVIKNH